MLEHPSLELADLCGQMEVEHEWMASSSAVRSGFLTVPELVEVLVARVNERANVWVNERVYVWEW